MSTFCSIVYLLAFVTACWGICAVAAFIVMYGREIFFGEKDGRRLLGVDDDGLHLLRKEKAYGKTGANKEVPEVAVTQGFTRAYANDADEIPFNGRIFFVMGRSASGKDTVYAKVMERLDESGSAVSPITTYTTRPKRDGERDGEEYFFLSDEGLNELEEAGKVIERRDYDTEYGIWSYATVDDGQVEEGGDYIIIGTPEMFESFRRYYPEDALFPMLIEVDDGTRIERAVAREKKQDSPRYDEMCRRFLSDAADFEKVESDGSVKRFENVDADGCADEIVGYIREMTMQKNQESAGGRQ